MAKHQPTDPLRVRLLDLAEQLGEHTALMRDYGTTPGNAWLAKGELQQVSLLVSELETLLEEIKQDDSENGY